VTQYSEHLFKPHIIRHLRSRALARLLEEWPQALVTYPSRLAEDSEHLRMTTVVAGQKAKTAR
jgi:hypothetical protein